MGGADTDTHYVEVAKAYEGAFFYESGPYQDHLLAAILSHMDLGSPSCPRDLRVVDLGGGTGNFTAALAAAAGLSRPILCVDNSAPMLAVAAGRAGVTPREQDAVAFAASADADAVGYDRVLLKEIVHHVPEAHAASMYAGLAAQLAPGGRCVTVTRPQEVEYPLWTAARAVWRAAQPPVQQIEAQVAAAGLAVQTHEAVYTATLPKERWFDMVRSRFWSTFSAFDDAGLEAGIAELAASHADTDVVTFNDRLLIIVGVKADTSGDDAGRCAVSAADERHALRHAFERDGVLLRERVLSEAEAADAYAAFRRYEVACGGACAGDARFKAHLLLPWLWRIVHYPRLVALVCAALGSAHVACWSTDIFAKEPGDGAFVTWHQDSTYAGMQPSGGLTLWLALTPSTAASGAVRFALGSHTRGQLEHARGVGGAANMLLAGQAALGVGDGLADTVLAELAPGEASLHHALTLHCSGANESSMGRVGIAMRFIPCHVTQQRQPRDSVAVVAGDMTAFADRYEIEREPRAEMDDEARVAHARAVAVVHPDAAEAVLQEAA